MPTTPCPQEIFEDEFIGDSREKINDNFSCINSKVSQLSGDITNVGGNAVTGSSLISQTNPVGSPSFIRSGQNLVYTPPSHPFPVFGTGGNTWSTVTPIPRASDGDPNLPSADLGRNQGLTGGNPVLVEFGRSGILYSRGATGDPATTGTWVTQGPTGMTHEFNIMRSSNYSVWAQIGIRPTQWAWDRTWPSFLANGSLYLQDSISFALVARNRDNNGEIWSVNSGTIGRGWFSPVANVPSQSNRPFFYINTMIDLTFMNNNFFIYGLAKNTWSAAGTNVNQPQYEIFTSRLTIHAWTGV